MDQNPPSNPIPPSQVGYPTPTQTPQTHLRVMVSLFNCLSAARPSLAQHLLGIGAAHFLLLSHTFAMSASHPHLHSLPKSLAPAEIHITLQNAAIPGESISVECVYQPYREWDVKKTRHFGLFSGWIGGNSREFFRVQRTEFHSLRQQIIATDSNMSFTVTTRDPDKEFKSYQLETIRVIGRLTGTFEFERWFPAAPQDLHPDFGLRCEATSLHGTYRPSGLAAQPLRGVLPLWPGLRNVKLNFTRVDVPTLQFFEARAKHHWEGWRQKSPQFWPGGQTILLRHTNSPTVWREHEYHAYAGSQDPLDLKINPPPDILPGVHLEIFWPDGPSLDFPETRVEVSPSFIALPISQMPPRMKELLTRSVQQRPGCEPGSLAGSEWHEIDQLVPQADLPLSIEMVSTPQNDNTLRITRQPGFTEPWICIFAAPYENAQRRIIRSMLIRPERWSGPLPE